MHATCFSLPPDKSSNHPLFCNFYDLGTVIKALWATSLKLFPFLYLHSLIAKGEFELLQKLLSNINQPFNSKVCHTNRNNIFLKSILPFTFFFIVILVGTSTTPLERYI
jgi:hypothetical protein